MFLKQLIVVLLFALVPPFALAVWKMRRDRPKRFPFGQSLLLILVSIAGAYYSLYFLSRFDLLIPMNVMTVNSPLDLIPMLGCLAGFFLTIPLYWLGMIIIFLYAPQTPRIKFHKIHQASCHCKAVEFEVHMPLGLVNPRRCDCSYCRMRGAIVATATLDGIKILKGQDKLTLYQFNTMTAKHYFCSVCGIYTHHQRRSNPSECGFNVACLEGVNPFELGDVPVMDGIHHPADR